MIKGLTEIWVIIMTERIEKQLSFHIFDSVYVNSSVIQMPVICDTNASLAIYMRYHVYHHILYMYVHFPI